MGSLLRHGRRQLAKKKLSEVKHHKRSFHKILSELDYISTWAQLEGIVFTEDNIEDQVKIVSDMKLGNMEKTILMSKQHENNGKQD
jgi:hypothetical protein